MDTPRGALISQVFDDTPAQGVGLQRGDVIVEFEGHAIAHFDDLPRRVAATAPGTEVSLIVLRDRTELDLRVRLAEMEE